MSLNNVTLVGRLTRDVELKYSQAGVAVARFNLAVNRQFKRDGQPDADFIGCIAFNKTAENLANYMRKGSQIGIVGRIQTGSYEKDGQKIYTTDVACDSIQFLESRGDQGGQQQGGQQQQQYSGQQQQQQFNQAPPQQQQQYGGQQQQFNQAPPQQQQFNQQRMSQDPFASANANSEVNPDDLPF